MNNAMNVMQMITNPQAFINDAMNNSQLMQNPVMKNAMDMYRNGNTKGLEQLANNVATQKGTSVDEIRKMFGL